MWAWTLAAVTHRRCCTGEGARAAQKSRQLEGKVTLTCFSALPDLYPSIHGMLLGPWCPHFFQGQGRQSRRAVYADEGHPRGGELKLLSPGVRAGSTGLC